MAEPLSLGQLGRVLFRYWILILVGTLVGGALAFGVTRFMTPVYRATAIQLVKGLPGTGAAANYEAAQYAVNRAKTYPSFVHSQEVLDGVRNDLGNTESVDQLRRGPFGDESGGYAIAGDLGHWRNSAGSARQGQLCGSAHGSVHHRDRNRRQQVTDHRGNGCVGRSARQRCVAQDVGHRRAGRNGRIRAGHDFRNDQLLCPIPAASGVPPEAGHRMDHRRVG